LIHSQLEGLRGVTYAHWNKITETTKDFKGDELAIEETGKPYLKGSVS
jgi:hypothetical protein